MIIAIIVARRACAVRGPRAEVSEEPEEPDLRRERSASWLLLVLLILCSVVTTTTTTTNNNNHTNTYDLC